MQTILIIILFIAQLISFYVIALLYMKIAKFDQLERKQKRLMAEMDQSIAAYLSEIKDDNEKLIGELTKKMNENQNEPKEHESIETQPAISVELPRNSMRHYARKSYETNNRSNEMFEQPGQLDHGVKLTTDQLREHESKVEKLDERSHVLQLAASGKSVEEIAKELGKGKTEIALILKFS